MKRFGIKQLVCLAISFSLMLMMASTSAYAANIGTETEVNIDISAELYPIMEEASRISAAGATAREIGELYYRAGYISFEDIDTIVLWDALSKSTGSMAAVGTEIGDIWEIDVTITRNEIIAAGTAVGVAGVLIDKLGKVYPPAEIAAAILTISGLIIDGIAGISTFKSVTVTGAFIYQYNPDNFTRQWMPYRFLKFTTNY